MIIYILYMIMIYPHITNVYIKCIYMAAVGITMYTYGHFITYPQ